MFDKLQQFLKDNLPQKIADAGYNNYEIFGKEVESSISDTIEEYLTTNKITYTPRRAKDKNTFPDLEVEIGGQKIALEHKAGIHSNKGEIEDTAANDMGTINAYPKKIQKYGDNMYCTFVKYSVLNDDSIDIEDIYFDKIYTFIGKRADGDYLAYREKDGNLRPKKWEEMSDETTYYHSLEEFQEALHSTSLYRSERIALKHIDNLRNEPTILETLKNHIDELLD